MPTSRTRTSSVHAKSTLESRRGGCGRSYQSSSRAQTLALGDGGFGRSAWTFREGAVLAGAFSVDRVDPGREVVLIGHHRMADFATNFYVEPTGDGRSRLHNVTRARFRTSGLGHLYLARVHVFHNPYVDWMLRALRRLAETKRDAAV